VAYFKNMRSFVDAQELQLILRCLTTLTKIAHKYKRELSHAKNRSS
jgi:hypothetical protein